MAQFLAIDHTHPDHHKHARFATAEDAQDHIDNGNLPDGFVAPDPGGNPEFWVVDMVAQTVVYDQVAADAQGLSGAVDMKISAINKLRDQKTNSPLAHAGVVLDADQGAQNAIHAAISYGAINNVMGSAIRDWTLADNTTQQVTWAAFRAMASAMFERASTLHGEARTHKDAINALTTVSEIEAYDIAIGWSV